MTAQIEKREIGNLLLEGIPEIPKTLSEKLNQYQNTREAHLVDWINKGEAILITTRFGDALQFHKIDCPGGKRTQLTFFKEPVFNGKASPDGNAFLFGKDIGGNEKYQLFHFNLRTGDCKMLTDGRSKNNNPIWNKTGDAFVYISTKRNKKDHDLYYFDLKSGQEFLLFEANGLWHPVDWSSDGQYLSVLNYRSINDCALYQLHLKTKALVQLSERGESIACRGGIWMPDGLGLFYTSDAHSQFRQLTFLNLKTQKRTILTASIEWDVEQLSLSPDGKTLAFTTNENGINKLYLLNTRNHSWRKVNDLSEGLISGLKWHPKKKLLALTINRANAPSDVFVFNLNRKTLEQWTFSELGGLDATQFIVPQLLHYPTFDDSEDATRMIPAFYYRPHTREQKHPVLIYIHGGPESQFRPAFLPVFQYYLNELGIAIIAPNVRGSTGYGKNFLKLDNGYKREDSVKDIGQLLDWIAQQPELDADRVAVIGGSYGGYMVLASMTHFNDRLRCGIDIVGISNFVTFLENTKSYRRDLRRVEYGDERDPDMRRHLESISPTSNAHKITKPMLIVQGLNDPRVPVSEAEQMLAAIRNNGGEVWYLLAKDEGHGFRKKSNRDVYSKAVILFLQEYLLG